MRLPTFSEVLQEAHRTVEAQGRVVLCQILRTEGSTPGKTGWKLLVRPDRSAYGNLGGGAFEALVKTDAVAQLAERRPRPEIRRYYFTEKAVRGQPTGMVCGGLAEVLLEVLMAKPLLAICGGGPIGQALAQNALICDFDVLVADDRAEFRRPELFPEGTLLPQVSRDYREDFLGPHAGRDLGVAVVTRCWETDLAALASVVRQRPAGLSYLGLMGSQRKVRRILEELAGQGASLAGVDLHAPIGLEIGGESPGEIAVSILAEIIQVRSRARRGEAAAAPQLEPAAG